MNMNDYALGTGCFTAAAVVAVYDVGNALTSAQTATGLAILAGVAVSAVCTHIYRCREKRQRKAWLKRHDKRLIERFMEETEQDYLVIPRDSYEAVYRHRRWETEEEPAEKKVPIREVKGALAEDFANASEEVKREMFG